MLEVKEIQALSLYNYSSVVMLHDVPMSVQFIF